MEYRQRGFSKQAHLSFHEKNSTSDEERFLRTSWTKQAYEFEQFTASVEQLKAINNFRKSKKRICLQSYKNIDNRKKNASK